MKKENTFKLQLHREHIKPQYNASWEVTHKNGQFHRGGISLIFYGKVIDQTASNTYKE